MAAHGLFHRFTHHVLHQGEGILLILASLLCLVFEKTKKQAAAFAFAGAALKINEVFTELFKIGHASIDLITLAKKGHCEAREHSSIISAGLGAMYSTVFIAGWASKSGSAASKVGAALLSTINLIVTIPVGLAVGLAALISFNRADIVALVGFEIYLAYYKLPVICYANGYGTIDYSGNSDLSFKIMAGIGIALIFFGIFAEICLKRNERSLFLHYYRGRKFFNLSPNYPIQREDLLEKLAPVYAFNEVSARNQRYRARRSDCMNPTVVSDEILLNTHTAMGTEGFYDCIVAEKDAVSAATQNTVPIDTVATIGGVGGVKHVP
jgi:hypothetical protein